MGTIFALLTPTTNRSSKVFLKHPTQCKFFSLYGDQIIGSYVMIGMNSTITKKKIIEPGYIYYGKPLKSMGDQHFLTLH